MNKCLPYFIVALLLFFIGCSKDKDNMRPTISISSPTHMQVINGLDTIQITATIKDDQNIESIQVSLKDENDNLVLASSAISVSPNTTEYNLHEWFFFDDINLPSGQYYFSFKASDGENTAYETVDVAVDEFPKQRLGVLLADNGVSNTTITFLDNSYNGSYYNSYAGDFLKFGINSFEQQLQVVTQNSKNIIAINLETGTTSWTSNTSSNIMGALIKEDYTYPGLYNGNIRRYNVAGAYNAHGNANVNSYMEEAAEHYNYLVMEQKEISTTNVQLVLAWVSSGAQVLQATIDEDILGIYGLDANNIALLTNNLSPVGNLIYYNITSGLTSSPFSINTGKIDACVEISTGIYLVSENGNLTLINAGSFSKSNYMSGVNANLLRYDYLTDELFIINGSQITIYDFSSKSLKGNYTHSSPVLDLDFWYNK